MLLEVAAAPEAEVTPRATRPTGVDIASGAAVLAGAIAAVPAAPVPVRVVALMTFLFVGPGVAGLRWFPRLPRYALVALSPVLGLAVVIVTTTPAAFGHFWHPRSFLVGMVALVAVIALAGLRWQPRAAPALALVTPLTARADHRRRRRTGSRVRAALDSVGRAPAVVYGIAAVCWLISLVNMGRAPLSTFGLLKAASPLFTVAIVATMLGAFIALRQGRWVGVFTGAVLLALVERLSASLATSVPLYPWTYKHIAVSDYLDRFGFVTRGADIYQSWPGMFAASAWFTRVAGVSSTGIAHWFTPTVHLLAIPLMFALARAWGGNNLVAAVGTLLFEAFSFVSQDYYSPQATAYLLALGILILMGLSRTRPNAVLISLVLFAAIVVTHQLTPYWLILATGLLAVTRRIRPFWLPGVFAVMAGAYLLLNYAVAHKYGSLVSVDPLQNLRLGTKAVPVFGIRLGFYLTEILYLLLFGLSALCFLVALRRWRQAPWAVAMMAFSPILIFLFQGYGGEAVFRVYLYALPAMVLLLASATVRVASVHIVGTVVVSVVALAATMASAQIYFGNWYAYRISKSEVAISRDFDSLSSSRAYFTPVSPGWPSRVDWHYFFHDTQRPDFDTAALSSSYRVATTFKDKKSYEEFMSVMLARTGGTTYVAFSNQSGQYGYLLGAVTKNALKNLENRMLHDHRWLVVAREHDAILFRLRA